MKLLFTVEDRFEIAGRGLIVVPGPLWAEYRGPGRLVVELKTPDGSSSRAMLTIQWYFQTPAPREPRWGCVFDGLLKEQVPVGTEVWYEARRDS